MSRDLFVKEAMGGKMEHLVVRQGEALNPVLGRLCASQCTPELRIDEPGDGVDFPGGEFEREKRKTLVPIVLEEHILAGRRTSRASLSGARNGIPDRNQVLPGSHGPFAVEDAHKRGCRRRV